MAISVIAGLAYFIPYATGTLLFVLSVVFALLEPQASVLNAVIGAGITALVGQAIESWFLTPRIVGKSAGLPPVFVVLAVLIGGELAGFVGILFSLPIATAVAAVVRASGELPYEEGDDDEHAG
jgi:predicted PurR-regulated permease PerM